MEQTPNNIEEKEIQEQPQTLEMVLAAVDNKEAIIEMLGKKDLPHLRNAKKNLKSWKRRFTVDKLTVKDPKDKEGIDKLASARREMRVERTALEDERTEIVDPHNRFVKVVNETYKPEIEDMKKHEAVIKKVKDDLDDLVEAEKKKEEKELADRINSRVKRLIDEKAIFDSEYYSVGSKEFDIEPVSIGMVQIASMADEDFELLIDQVKEKVLAIKDAEADKKRKADEAQQKLLDDQQKILDQQKLQEEAQKNIDEQNKAIKARIVNTRSRELKSLGFNINVQGNYYVHASGKSISLQVVEDTEDSPWDELIQETEKIIEEATALSALKEKRHQQLVDLNLRTDIKFEGYSYKRNGFEISQHIVKDDDGQWEKYIDTVKAFITRTDNDEVTQQARYDRIKPYAAFFDHPNLMDKLYIQTDEEFEALFSEKQSAYDKKISDDIQAEKEKQANEEKEKLAASSDKQKWAHFIQKLAALEISEMESDEFKKVSEEAKSMITAIINLK